jgi:DNA modification methylase
MEVKCISDGSCTASGPRVRTGLDWKATGAGGEQRIPQPLVPDFNLRPYQIYCGDALDTIRRLKAGGTQFDCVVTSPPYYNLRNYGGDAREIGRESDVSSFVSSLVGVFREIPLRPWASVWVNLGDKRGPSRALLGVPHLFIGEMLKNGFFLMDDVIWAKEVVPVEGKSIGHCQIEPALGRLNGNGWEPFFHFVPDPKKAWSDTSAVRIPRDEGHFFHQGTDTPVKQHRYSKGMECVTSLEGRNLSNVWSVNNSREGNGHFSAYPKELVERPIAMTCPEWLVQDGEEIKPRVRIIEPTEYSEGSGRGKRAMGQYSLAESKDGGQLTPEEQRHEEKRLESLREKSGRMDFARSYTPRYPKPMGWTHMDKPVVGPGIVLDPFGGNGTTGHVAVLLSRRFVGIDLYEENARRMSGRCEEAFMSLTDVCSPGPPSCADSTFSCSAPVSVQPCASGPARWERCEAASQ